MDIDGATAQQGEDDDDEDEDEEGRIAGHTMTAFEPGQFFVIDTSEDSQLHEVRRGTTP